MQVEFLSKFSKDIDHISQKSVRSNLSRLIKSFELAENLNNISNLKKLDGHKSAYRVRIGDYKIILARVVHRKDIYKVFP